MWFTYGTVQRKTCDHENLNLLVEVNFKDLSLIGIRKIATNIINMKVSS